MRRSKPHLRILQKGLEIGLSYTEAMVSAPGDIMQMWLYTLPRKGR